MFSFPFLLSVLCIEIIKAFVITGLKQGLAISKIYRLKHNILKAPKFLWSSPKED